MLARVLAGVLARVLAIDRVVYDLKDRIRQSKLLHVIRGGQERGPPLRFYFTVLARVVARVLAG